LAAADAAVLLFGRRRLPRALSGLPAHRIGQPRVIGAIDDLVDDYGRLIVVGADADLAAVLTGLLRSDRLDVEVGYAPRWWRAQRARTGTARRVPLIRDDTGQVIIRAAQWIPERDEPGARLRGEAVVDDTVLFDGEATAVRIQPTLHMPGLRAALTDRKGPRRWVSGRAAQLGTTGARVVRDGILAPRPVRRSTFYRHVEGWLMVG
jgi:hypothetical protein